ncbi:ABC transporter ATP-binding protein [Halorussus salinisoli]|uniref:ABC transporter ATP-binding protein n=1 Tax=Halorussus salinisoli TaxID=2558242 RepID=UPI0010C21EF4|nr:ABC transporter ATP-binding protein [Halorussus salinisoli]
MTLLEAENVHKSFDGVQALDGAEITVEAGELVGLIGPNGAGKTTLFDCLSGVTDLDAGTVHFDGEDVTDLPTYRRARRGMVRTFQHTRELETLTVTENVRLPAGDHPGESALDALVRTDRAHERETEVAARATELVDFFDLGELADEYAGHLSGGQRKLLEFARALMLDPDLLLLDEPLAGVNPTLARKISGHVERLNDEGTTFLIVEHEIESLAALVDRLVVLNEGRVLAEGEPRAVLDDERVIEAYLGEPIR